MSAQPTLEQRLWDFVYDLTSPDEAAALRARIASDPDVARRYAEVRLQADILAEAAQLHDEEFQFERPADEALADQRDELFPARRLPTPVRVASWSVAIAASLLLCLLGYASLRPQSPLRETALATATEELQTSAVHTTLIGPAKLQAGQVNYLTIMTQSPTKPAPPVQVEYELRDEAGQVVDRGQASDEATGVVQVRTTKALPATRLVMEVKTNPGRDLPPLTQTLPVAEDAPVLALRTDRPVYAPGETVRYRALALSRPDQKARAKLPVQVALADPVRGERLAEGPTHETDDAGVVAKQFTLPEAIAAGRYVLRARAADRKAVATDVAITIQNPDAAPDPGAAHGLSAPDQPPVPNAARDASANADSQALALNVGRGIMAGGGSIEVTVPSRDVTPSLALVARSQGLVVGQKSLASEKAAADQRGLADCDVSIPLEPEAAGVIRLTAYDYALRPPQPVAERFVFRRPAESLRVDVYPPDPSTRPGATVRLELAVQNEVGKPMPSVLGVAVMDEAWLQAAGDTPPSLAAQWWLTSQLPPIAWDRSPDFYLDPQNEDALSELLRRHSPPAGSSAQGLMLAQTMPTGSVSGTLAYGMLGDEAAAAKSARAVTDPTAPRVLAQNVRQVRTAVAREVSNLRDLREAAARHLGGLVAVLSLGLWIAVALLAILRLTGARVWVPALTTATICLIVGGLWMNAQVDDRGQLAWLPQWTAPRELAKAEPAPSGATAPAAGQDAEPATTSRDAAETRETAPGEERVAPPAATETRPAFDAEEPAAKRELSESADAAPTAPRLEGRRDMQRKADNAAGRADAYSAPEPTAKAALAARSEPAAERVADRPTAPAPAAAPGSVDAVRSKMAATPEPRPMEPEGGGAADGFGMGGMGGMRSMRAAGGGVAGKPSMAAPYGAGGALKDNARRGGAPGYGAAAPRAPAAAPAPGRPLGVEQGGGPGVARSPADRALAEKDLEKKMADFKLAQRADEKQSLGRGTDSPADPSAGEKPLAMKEQDKGDRDDANRAQSEAERLADKRKALKPEKRNGAKSGKADDERLAELRGRTGANADDAQVNPLRMEMGPPEARPAPAATMAPMARTAAKGTAAPSGELGRRLRKSAADQDTFASAVVYWEPELKTDDEGKAKIEFTLPRTPGTFRVTIDAHAPGVIGSKVLYLSSIPPAVAAEVVRDAPPAASAAPVEAAKAAERIEAKK